MAPAVIQSADTTPDAIEEALTQLWREAGREAPVARAVLSNLVVVCERGPHDTPDLTLAGCGLPIEAVVRQHPCRAILVHHAPDRDATQKPVAAAVSVLCFGAGAARYGVEAIAISSHCIEASLPSIVRRLVIGDVPTTVWWPGDFSRRAPLEAVAAMGRQFVYDSGHWLDVRAGAHEAARLVARPRIPELVDLNWRRLRPMRMALAQAASRALNPRDLHVTQVRVQHGPGDAALAWLLVGWLDAALRGSSPAVVVDEAPQGDEILSVTLGRETVDVVATMTVHRVVVTFPGRTAPLVVAVPEEDRADAIASELRSLDVDAVLHDAIVALDRRLSATAA
jgi:glucose-6-phosphate dehydrogenase assembly protein OpcA